MEAHKLQNNKTNEASPERREKSNIVLYLTSKLVSLFGTYIYNFALSLYILKVTGSGISFGLSLLTGMIPRIIFGPFAGSVADRVDRKKMTILLDIVSGLTIFAILGLAMAYGLQIAFIYITSFILATISTFFNTALGAALPNLVRAKGLMKINSYSGAADSISGIVSPVLGGMVYGLVPVQIFLMVNAASFFVSAFLELFIDFNLNKPKEQEASKNQKLTAKAMLEDIREGFEFIKEQKALFTILKYALLLNFFTSACLSVAYPYILNNTLKMTSSQYGIIQGAFPVGILIASIAIGKLAEPEKKRKSMIVGLIAIGTIMGAMGIPGLAFVQTIGINSLFAYYIILSFVLALAIIMVNVPLNVSVQRMTPDGMRGRVMGVLGTFASGIAPLGVVLGGMVIDVAPIYSLFFTCSAAIVFSALLMMKNKSLEGY